MLGNNSDGFPAYIDRWFESIKKPQAFYDAAAGTNNDPKSNKPIRRYFYNIDLQGRLFLEETSPKNIATSIKDEKFLNFFFSRIRCASPSELEYLASYDAQDDYPYVSQCGIEINYIRPAATPIVFHSLTTSGLLLFGGNLEEKFDGSKLAMSCTTGRLYHQLDSTNKQQTWQLGYGLIRSQLAVILAEKITEDNEGKFVYDGQTEIDWLPYENEPGRWSMPQHDTESLE
jgi:hypothetical protein